jgi:hypothetical protein
LNGSAKIADRLSVSLDAAWLPYTRLDASDTHWLRLEPRPIAPGGFAGPLPEDGIGHHGVELEGQLNYDVTESVSLGVGARYWKAETAGHMHFEGVVIGGGAAGAQPLDYSTERYGVFVQAGFKF